MWEVLLGLTKIWALLSYWADTPLKERHRHTAFFGQWNVTSDMTHFLAFTSHNVTALSFPAKPLWKEPEPSRDMEVSHPNPQHSLHEK